VKVRVKLSLSPDCTVGGEWHAVLSQQLRGDNAQGTEQGPAGVDQLDGPVACEGVLHSKRGGQVGVRIEKSPRTQR